jgi:hypothetical protein
MWQFETQHGFRSDMQMEKRSIPVNAILCQTWILHMFSTITWVIAQTV